MDIFSFLSFRWCFFWRVSTTSYDLYPSSEHDSAYKEEAWLLVNELALLGIGQSLFDQIVDEVKARLNSDDLRRAQREEAQPPTRLG